jgi:hypothetical protein
MPMMVAVRSIEFQALVRRVPFVALPREEIDRLHAAIEVLAVDEATLRHTAEFVALHSYIAIHHNYSWLTFRRHDDQRTLLLSTILAPEGPVPLFLGEELVVSARRHVEERLGLDGGCEVRLAGILQEIEGRQPLPRVGLLSIARLAGRTATCGAECCGNLELRHARSQFDPCSQVVIDHLEAL